MAVRIHSHLCFAFVVCSVEYRLAPEHPFPAAVADAAAALRWARSHARAHGGDSGRIVLAGESAGGNVAAAAALANYDSRHTSLLGRTRLAGLWLLYPCLDYGHVYPSYLQYGSRDYPLLSLQYLLFYWSHYLGKDVRRTSLDYRAGTSDAGCPRSPSFPSPTCIAQCPCAPHTVCWRVCRRRPSSWPSSTCCWTRAARFTPFCAVRGGWTRANEGPTR